MVRDRSRFYWSPRWTAVLMVLLPLSLERTDFRSVFGQGLSIAPNKTSPAYAALEDLHHNYVVPTVTVLPSSFEMLSAGQKFKPSAAILATTVRTLTMKGLVVRAATQDLVPRPFYVAGESRTAVSPTLTNERGELLSLASRKRTIARYLESQPELIKVDAEASPAARARELVAQELAARSERGKSRQEMRSITGNTIIVAKSDLRPDPLPSVPEDPLRKSHEEEPAPEEPVVYYPSVSSVSPTSDQMRPLWLNGQVEMTGGLAFVGSSENTLVVRRMVDGQTLEKGRIWVNEGRFEIFVKSTTGQLVAELLGREGRVLGRGELNLVQIREIPTRDNRIYDLHISLRPVTEAASLRALSGYSHGQQMMPIRSAKFEIQNFTSPQKVNDEGYFTEPNLSRDSSYVARASAPKHWSSVVVGQAQSPQDVRLFSEKLMDALIGLEVAQTSDRREAGFASVVWGQVKRMGRPTSGAVVEMAGGYSPIYLNEMYLPDPNLKATSGNGLFAFIKVRRGVQALRVTDRGHRYPAQVFPTEDKHVSYLEMELEDKVVGQFRVMDALNPTASIEARIRMVGTDDVISIQGQGTVEYSSGANPHMVEAEAGPEYEVTRVTLTGKPETAHLPLIRHDWLTELFNRNNVLALPGRGMIVGLIDDQDFEVDLTGYAPNEQMQIIYFDAKGRPTGHAHGVAGGGFVIFNAPQGLQTVFIKPANSREIFSQVVVAEPEYVHVVTWSPGS